MKMLIPSLPLRVFCSVLFALPLVCGCEDGGGGGTDLGDNDPNLVACIGDSITDGYASEGAPYPSRLAAKSGKNVLNFGSPGASSAYGASIISSVVARKPGYVCILLGSNDAIHGRPVEDSIENLRHIITTCKANKSKPILATPPKMIRSHELFDPAAERLADAIRRLAREEGVTLVDLYKAFGDGEAWLTSDGLHLNDAGGELVANQFNSRI